jgi:hypothetical protein
MDIVVVNLMQKEKAMAARTSSGDSLETLKPLVGAWRLVATFKDMPPADIGARVTFEWLPGERFLIQRWEIPIPEAPDGIAIIGPDPEREGNYLQHYFDSRGVARTPAPSAMTARPSPVPGRSATTARPGSTTSTSHTPRHDEALELSH